jgi:pimeloyl-ACP methyl ester carboxylesterase
VRDGSALTVEATFARASSGFSGSFSSSQLLVIGIPLSDITYDPPHISWKIIGDDTTTVFDGSVQGDLLTGSYTDGGGKGTFSLRRGKAEAAEVRETEIMFRNGAVALSGTVVSPPGAGPFPGVVFLHGSGPEGRWANRYLAHAFARHDVAALIFDKRGVGGSMGDWRKGGFEDLVGDDAAAVEALRSQPQISRDCVGIFGHSQGATIAPWVATRDGHVAFVVAAAAGGVSMADMEIFSLSHDLKIDGLPSQQKALASKYIRAVVATAYEGAPRSQLERIWQEVRGYPWAFPPPPESDSYWSFSRQNANFDPLAFWRRVTVPTLLLYGDHDEREPPRLSAARIAQAYLEGHGPSLQVIVFPHADHSYRLVRDNKGKFSWPQSAPGYPDRAIAWVLGHVGPACDHGPE